MIERNPLFYRGERDTNVVTADNGARVSKEYAEFVNRSSWAEVKTHKLGERIYCVTGLGLPNYTFIEGDTGLILVNTGLNRGTALELLKLKQLFSDKPIVAIIYSHHYYTGGAQAIVDEFPNIDVAIYGHPNIEQNLTAFFSYMAPAKLRRAGIQVGRRLPASGPDAPFGVRDPRFSEPELNAFGHVPANHVIVDGEKANIDGLDIRFYHAVADTDDSLIMHIPELDAVIHNTAAMPFLFPLYTLRGELYRAVPEVLLAVDKLRELKPEYLVGCHGFPVIGQDQAYEFATAQRDALAFIYQQTVKGINHGLTPSQIVAEFKLPEQLAKRAELFPAYVDIEHMVRGVYRGLIGWWAEDTAELYPPTDHEFGDEVVYGFGGADAVLERANIVLQEKRYNLAAKLASLVLAHDQNNCTAKLLKARALRKMAYTTPTGTQSRNFLLNEALQLENRIPSNDGRVSVLAGMPIEMIAAMPADNIAQTLCYTIDGAYAAGLIATLKVTITDVGESFGLAIRNGAVEFFSDGIENADIKLSFDRRTWAELFLKQTNLLDLIGMGRATFSGDDKLQAAVIAAYHEIF